MCITRLHYDFYGKLVNNVNVTDDVCVEVTIVPIVSACGVALKFLERPGTLHCECADGTGLGLGLHMTGLVHGTDP